MKDTIPGYGEAIEFLYARIDYERLRPGSYTARDLKLERMRQLLNLLDRPQEKIPAVHIAGTKGKGSTAVMVAGILSAAGYRTGLFTSPHLSAFEERMVVDRVPPEKPELVELVNQLAGPVAEMDRGPEDQHPTFFEITTALAWLYFLRRRADVAVLEVGLGGRLDATNLCRPEATVITNISRDHTALLGETPAQIAREKAGIIKPGVPVISGVRNEEAAAVISEVCRDRRAPLFELNRSLRFVRHRVRGPGGAWPSGHAPGAPAVAAGEAGAVPAVIDVQTPWQTWSGIPVPLAGGHQAANAALALGVVGLLAERGWSRGPDFVEAGLRQVRWPVRIEVLNRRPAVVIDSAHNGASATALVETLKESFAARRRVLVFGASRDKDVPEMLSRLLPEFETVVLTQYRDNPRALPVDDLERIARNTFAGPMHRADDPPAAWRLARQLASVEDLICITGSFFLAAELRNRVLSDRVRGAAVSTEASG